MSFFLYFLAGILKALSHHQSQHTMAGFRQEDVELYYEMGEELGRYVTVFFFFFSLKNHISESIHLIL